ncbi:hypothetical protein [uncultured Desulfobulbus sp.]|uniref:hypothetical protein n=1 Tax=uncultured Desulfobulbus sp. TaxID=239745 RepID=UPI0029C723D6|nr:hypothetical protein [uncultured Desulfobulbus sp.]
MDKKKPPNKPRILSFLLILPILALLVGSTANAAGFRLIYANDNLGELDGCG